MSYTNKAGQTVNVGDRVAYAGYHGHLYLGKVASFTPAGSPRIELENATVPMVRERWSEKVFVKSASANIWDRRPGAFYKHKQTGHLVTRKQWHALPYSERTNYEYDHGLLGDEWVEFTVPAVFTASQNKDRVFVIEAAK